MIIFSLLIISIAIAVLSILLLFQCRRLTLTAGLSVILLSLSLALFIYLYGTWVFISVYVKYLFAACYCVTLLWVILKRKPNANKSLSKVKKVVFIFISVLLIVLDVLYYTGTAGKPYGVIDLQLPIRSGTYFVFQGGKGLPSNVFHATGRRTLFAMDIIKLNKYGNRADHIFSKKLDDYEIFGDTIYSPCSGVVVKTENDNPDNIPPLRKRGPSNTNQVLIETDNAYVFLGHLKQHCLFVKAGDKIAAGQPLGLAGNSGMSIEPHLHIQAHAKTNTGAPWYREPQLLMKFNGKSYLLFDEIKAEERR